MTARRPRINRHFRIDRDLSAQQKDQYLDYLREPGTTVDSAHAKLREMGHPSISRSAVARHLRHYLSRIEAQRLTADTARCYARFAASRGPDNLDMLRGALLRVDQLLLESVFDLREQQGASAAELMEFADALERLIDVQKKLRGLIDGAGEGARERTVNGEEVAREVRKLMGWAPAPEDN